MGKATGIHECGVDGMEVWVKATQGMLGDDTYFIGGGLKGMKEFCEKEKKGWERLQVYMDGLWIEGDERIL